VCGGATSRAAPAVLTAGGCVYACGCACVGGGRAHLRSGRRPLLRRHGPPSSPLPLPPPCCPSLSSPCCPISPPPCCPSLPSPCVPRLPPPCCVPSLPPPCCVPIPLGSDAAARRGQLRVSDAVVDESARQDVEPVLPPGRRRGLPMRPPGILFEMHRQRRRRLQAAAQPDAERGDAETHWRSIGSATSQCTCDMRFRTPSAFVVPAAAAATTAAVEHCQTFPPGGSSTQRLRHHTSPSFKIGDEAHWHIFLKTKICDTPRARKNDAQPHIVTMFHCPGTDICRMHPI
jgi:hypothetical protein